MQKYFNNIIFILGTILLINQPIGISFIIPIVIYLKQQSYKNYLISIVLILLSILLNYNMLMIPTLITFGSLSLYFILTYKTNKKTMDLIITFILSLYMNFSLLINTKNYLYILILSMISVLVLVYFYYNQNAITTTTNFDSNLYNELIMSIVSIMGFTQVIIYNVNIGIISSCYFTMYFSSLKQYKKSIFLVISTLIILQFIYKLDYAYLSLIVAGIYLFPRLISLLVLLIFVSYFSFINTTIFPINLLELLGICGIIFAIISLFSTDEEHNDIVDNIYENINQKINNATLSFSTFLDGLTDTYDDSKKDEKQAEIFQQVYSNHCDRCHFKNDCVKSKGRLYHFYKEVLNEQTLSEEFCPNYIEIKRTMYNLKNKYNYQQTKPSHILSNITNGLSVVLKQYAIDKTKSLEYEYLIFINIKKALIAYGFHLTLYEVRKTFVDDFLIEIGIKEYKNNKEVIEKIVYNHMKVEVSIVDKEKKGNKTYFNIVPKLNYDVMYGYGSLASVGSNVCGDNYLIKQLDDSKVIAAISDGMGHGMKANIESVKTLNMINSITNMDLSCEASLQILNTLIYIQDYEDMFSTLDFIQIDRKKGEALIYKAGATTTYLFHIDGTYKKIINENLPFGIEEIIDIKKIEIQNGDLIILASDGVFENVLDNNELERHMVTIMNNDPQNIIYDLLNYIRYSKVKTKDDMSIIALKVFKC